MDISRRIDDIMGIDHSAPAVHYRGQWWDWGTVRRFGDRLDALYARLPALPEGTPIAVVMRNRPPHVATILHALRCRYCLVPISSIQDPHRIAEDVRGQRPSIVIADSEDWSDELANAAHDCGAFGIRCTGEGLEVVTSPERNGAHEERRPGTAVWMPTSGTTGPPKRIPITYRDLEIGFDRVRKYARTNERAAVAARLSTGVVISCTPLVHIAGLWQLLQAAVEGRRLVLLDRFEPRAWACAAAEHQPRVTMLPPAALTMLLDAGIPAGQLASLRAVQCTTAALSPDVEERFTRHFGVPVLSGYGATEFPGGLSGWTLQDKTEFGDRKRGSVGRARPGIGLRIVDQDSGDPVATGTVGLVEVRSAQTAARGVDGWVRTTDLGTLDEDGFLWITGRADGAINRGGFKILPETVEQALLSHPSVSAAGVIGLPDPRLGQVPVAGVEVRSPVDEAELLEWTRGRLLKYQVPVSIAIVDSLPRTPSMKVSRPLLREMLAGQR